MIIPVKFHQVDDVFEDIINHAESTKFVCSMTLSDSSGRFVLQDEINGSGVVIQIPGTDSSYAVSIQRKTIWFEKDDIDYISCEDTCSGRMFDIVFKSGFDLVVSYVA